MSITRSKYIFSILIFIFAVYPFYALAADSSILHIEFNAEVGRTISKILANSDIKSWAMALALFIAFVSLVVDIIVWIRFADVIPFLTTAILIIAFGSLYVSFVPVVDIVFGALTQLGESMYSAGIGSQSTDAIYNAFVGAVGLPTVGFFDPANMIFISFLWYVMTGILSMAVYFADIWLITGASIAKVVGILFIPFIISKYTHAYFVRWFNFLVLWGVASIFLQVTSILCLLVMKASLNAVAKSQNATDIINSNFSINRVMQFSDDNINLMFSLIAFTGIAAIMIFGSFKLAAQCMAGGGTAGQSLNNGAVALAKKIAVIL